MTLRHLASALALLAACGGSKEPTYFALAPRIHAAEAGAPTLIEVRRPGLAGYLDRPEIVKTVKDYRLQLETGERWAEPLGDMIGRVIASDLSSRLEGSQIFVENGAISAIPEAVVAIDVQMFDAGADGALRLVAEVVIEARSDPKLTRAKHFALQAHLESGSTAALVAGMSTLLAELADGIAAMLRGH